MALVGKLIGLYFVAVFLLTVGYLLVHDPEDPRESAKARLKRAAVWGLKWPYHGWVYLKAFFLWVFRHPR